MRGGNECSIESKHGVVVFSGYGTVYKIRGYFCPFLRLGFLLDGRRT